MLGSLTDADDAIQEAWLRLSRSDPRDIENLGGWLTTVVARVCLDILRSLRSLLPLAGVIRQEYDEAGGGNVTWASRAG